MEVKHAIALGAGAALLAALVGVQSCRVSTLKKEIAAKESEQDYNQEKIRIEKVYIPKKVGELTYDQLTKLLNAVVE